jgi:hypothetical protein
LLPSLRKVKDARKHWNLLVEKYLGLQPTMMGKQVSLENVLKLILLMAQYNNIGPIPNKLQLKLTLDGRMIGGKSQVLVGIIPLNLGYNVQSEKSTFPLMIINGSDQDLKLLESSTKSLVEELKKIQKGIFWNHVHYFTDIYLAADLASLWKLTHIE